MRLPRKPLFCFAIITSVVLGAAWTILDDRHTPPVAVRRTESVSRSTKRDVWKLPPPRTSPYENTRADVTYVGTQQCVECHVEAHASYLETAHSRALGEIDIEQEPHDAEFFHAPSHRRYEIKRQEDQLWHIEWASDGEGDEFLLAAHALRFRIGSGHHSRSYLAEPDGYLIESPATWYASTQSWKMSPGYDVPFHSGFERIADDGCLQCHAGRVEPIDSRFRVRIQEASIGCENCHGPGSRHAERRRADSSSQSNAQDVLDLTIVNPDDLSRDLQEAICAQCHLRGVATVLVKGRSLADFRPGLRLEDFRIHYTPEQPGELMTVVGHIEQMRSSRCYQASEEFTCTTCHDPHAKTEESRPSYFRDKCLECHADCGLNAAVRLEREPSNNCVACHMPKTSTDLPHIVFTHHRVAIPADTVDTPPESNEGVAQLVPTSDISHLPSWEQQRCLALAYLEASEGKQDGASSRYRAQAVYLLETLRRDGIDDIEVNAALARLYWEQDRLTDTISLAESVVQSQSESGSMTNALLVLGDSYLQLNQPLLAREALRRLVTLRRQSEDWVMLATCLRGLGELQDAIDACQKAIEIQPNRPDVHRILAEIYAELGNAEAAAQHRTIANTLERLLPHPP